MSFVFTISIKIGKKLCQEEEKYPRENGFQIQNTEVLWLPVSMNVVMIDGKKSVAEKIVYGVLMI